MENLLLQNAWFNRKVDAKGNMFYNVRQVARGFKESINHELLEFYSYVPCTKTRKGLILHLSYCWKCVRYPTLLRDKLKSTSCEIFIGNNTLINKHLPLFCLKPIGLYNEKSDYNP